MKPRNALLLSALLFVPLVGCLSDEAAFKQGRLQAFCDRSIAICSAQASCVLDDTTFARSQFPGGLRAVLQNDFDEDTVIVRILLTEALAPGTELHVELLSPDCGRVEEERIVDVDLFEVAGNERLYEFEFPFHGRGDHLLSVFSDMNAQYLLAVTYN